MGCGHVSLLTNSSDSWHSKLVRDNHRVPYVHDCDQYVQHVRRHLPAQVPGAVVPARLQRGGASPTIVLQPVLSMLASSAACIYNRYMYDDNAAVAEDDTASATIRRNDRRCSGVALWQLKDITEQRVIGYIVTTR